MYCYYDVISNVSDLVLFHLLHSLRSLQSSNISYFFFSLFVLFIPQVFQKLWMSLCNNASSSSGK